MNVVVDTLKDKVVADNLLIRLIIEVCIGGIIYCVLTLVGMLLIKKSKKDL